MQVKNEFQHSNLITGKFSFKNTSFCSLSQERVIQDIRIISASIDASADVDANVKNDGDIFGCECRFGYPGEKSIGIIVIMINNCNNMIDNNDTDIISSNGDDYSTTTISTA